MSAVLVFLTSKYTCSHRGGGGRLHRRIRQLVGDW